MSLDFRALSEDAPGPKWAGAFEDYWPAYRKWWGSEGLSARPTYLECTRALKRHMPEIFELYEELCELAENSLANLVGNSGGLSCLFVEPSLAHRDEEWDSQLDTLEAPIFQ